MKVKTQYKIFDSSKEPIELVLNDAEKRMIFSLRENQHCILFPYQMKVKTAYKKLKVLVKRKK
jgi:hypothetical protein